MRILLCANAYPPSPGGIQTYAYEMARHLSGLGEEVNVLARSEVKGWDGDKTTGAKGIVRCRTKPGLCAGFFDSLWRHDIELIFITHRANFLSWALAAKRGRPRLRIVVTLHGNEVYGRPDLPRLISQVNRADGVLAVSQYSAERFSQLGVRREILHVVPNGVDPQRFSPKTEGGSTRARLGLNDRPILLSMGRLVPFKAHDQVLRALPAILAEVPDAIYLVVGEGPQAAALRRLAEELQVENHVRWHPAVPYDALGHPPHAYYNASHLLVGPSRIDPKTEDIEAFGIVFLEAAACGRPVVAGRYGGGAEAVVDGETGFVVESEDPQAIARAVIQLLKDENLARKMGEAGRRRVETSMNWGACAERTLKIVRQVKG